MDLKTSLLNPKLGGWRVGSQMMGETVPKETNYAALDPALTGAWGIPQLKITITFDDNDSKTMKNFQQQFTEMFTEAGSKNIRVRDNNNPSLEIHETNGVRRSKGRKTSMPHKWNQLFPTRDATRAENVARNRPNVDCWLNVCSMNSFKK